MIDIIIPAAGNGLRFVEAGYMLPKPLIDIEGKPMLQRVIENIKPKKAHRFIIISRLHVDKVKPLTKGKDDLFIQLGGPTEGAIDTILQAENDVDSSPLLIANCDQLVDFDVDLFISCCEDFDGGLVTFKSKNPHHSYVHTVTDPLTNDDIITQIAEKEVISTNAISGIYYFKNGQTFMRFAREVLEDNERFKNEFYVSSAIKRMIEKDYAITTYDAPTLILGTPQELQTFEVALRIGNKLL